MLCKFIGNLSASFQIHCAKLSLLLERENGKVYGVMARWLEMPPKHCDHCRPKFLWKSSDKSLLQFGLKTKTKQNKLESCSENCEDLKINTTKNTHQCLRCTISK